MKNRHIRELLLYAMVLVGGTALFVHLDAYEAFQRFSRAQEGWELDELAMMLPAVLICLVIFSYNRLRELKRRTRLLEKSRRELARAHESLRSLSQSREAFMITACHELKSPLVGIVNALELVRLSDDEAERQEMLDMAGIAARRLGVLVDNVLEFARQEAPAPARKPFAPAELMASIMDMSVLQARTEGLDLVVELDPAVPDRVLASESVLRLVALNLVGNAMRYTDEGGVRVELGYLAEPEGELVLVVEDTGRGIAGEAQKSIFDPFTRIEPDGKELVKGLGIGLAIVKRNLERHNGTIAVESTPGSGSRFTVRLPAEAVME